MIDSAEVAQMQKPFLHNNPNQQRSLQLLERPDNTLGFLYHIAVFSCILFVCCLSAMSDLDEQVLDFIHYMEIFLAIYFLLEFLSRLWSVGADGKYQGVIGRLIYLRRPVCLIDVLVLCATFFVFLWSRISLFHIDRQMTTWKLIKNMVQRSKFELISAYYTTFMVFLTMSVLVYNIETTPPSSTPPIYSHFPVFNGSQTTESPATFANFGESFWFSIVSVLTIGYGDIVPKQWQSKVVVCLLSYVGLSMFSAASGLVGVGMSLMLHNQHKEKKQGKVRHLAACTIQAWYRFHLISDEHRFVSIPAYRKYCAKLQQVEERIRKTRVMLKIANERRLKKRSVRLTKVLKRQMSVQEFRNAEAANPESEVTKSLIKAATHVIITDKIAEEHRPPSPLLQTHRSPSPTTSLRKMLLNPELSPSASIKRASFESVRRSSALPFSRNNVFMESFRRSSDFGENDMTTSDTTSTISLDLSDDEKLLDYYYDQPYRSHSDSQNSQDNSSKQFEIYDLLNNGCILRMIYFFLFITNVKRFKRARKPYEMLDAEAELCEMEHQNSQKFKELELRLEATIGGKPTGSALQPPQPQEHNSASIQQRLQISESKLQEVEQKAEFIEHLAGLILKNMQQKDFSKAQPDLEATKHPGSMLPPVFPGTREC
uniref:Potassium channel domain-containing protein n=1 Tax=Ditylenchus dipsaci TaxID=166011 RepID=A0A915CPU5_9BILA